MRTIKALKTQLLECIEKHGGIYNPNIDTIIYQIRDNLLAMDKVASLNAIRTLSTNKNITIFSNNYEDYIKKYEAYTHSTAFKSHLLKIIGIDTDYLEKEQKKIGDIKSAYDIPKGSKLKEPYEPTERLQYFFKAYINLPFEDWERIEWNKDVKVKTPLKSSNNITDIKPVDSDINKLHRLKKLESYYNVYAKDEDNKTLLISNSYLSADPNIPSKHIFTDDSNADIFEFVVDIDFINGHTLVVEVNDRNFVSKVVFYLGLKKAPQIMLGLHTTSRESDEKPIAKPIILERVDSEANLLKPKRYILLENYPNQIIGRFLLQAPGIHDLPEMKSFTIEDIATAIKPLQNQGILKRVGGCYNVYVLDDDFTNFAIGNLTIEKDGQKSHYKILENEDELEFDVDVTFYGFEKMTIHFSSEVLIATGFFNISNAYNPELIIGGYLSFASPSGQTFSAIAVLELIKKENPFRKISRFVEAEKLPKHISTFIKTNGIRFLINIQKTFEASDLINHKYPSHYKLFTDLQKLYNKDSEFYIDTAELFFEKACFQLLVEKNIEAAEDYFKIAKEFGLNSEKGSKFNELRKKSD